MTFSSIENLAVTLTLHYHSLCSVNLTQWSVIKCHSLQRKPLVFGPQPLQLQVHVAGVLVCKLQ